MTTLIERICTGQSGCARPKQQGCHDDERDAAARRQGPADHFDEVVVDGTALAHGRDDRSEVVVGEHDVSGLLGGLCALGAHGDADVRLPQFGSVVDAIAGHRDDGAAGLHSLDEAQLVLRARRANTFVPTTTQCRAMERGLWHQLQAPRFGDFGVALAVATVYFRSATGATYVCSSSPGVAANRVRPGHGAAAAIASGRACSPER